MCTGGCLAVSLHSTPQTPVVPQPNHANRKCVQRSPNIPQKRFLKSHVRPLPLASLNKACFCLLFPTEIRGAPTPSTKCSTSLLAHTDLPGFTFLLIHHLPLSGLLRYSTEGVPGTVRCLNMSGKAWRLQSHCGCKTDSWKAKDKGSPRDSAISCQLIEGAS